MKNTLFFSAALLATFTPSAIAQLSGEPMYRVYGQPHAQLSKARCIDDLNGDGCVDFIVGSPLSPKVGNRGYCAVISGADGSTIREHTGLTSTSWFGQDFTNLHDLNGDGIDEYAISAPGYRIGADQGVVFIYDGATGAELRQVRDLGVTSRMGDFIMGGTDFTGDDVPDLVVVAAKQSKIKIYDGTELEMIYSEPVKVLDWGVDEVKWYRPTRPMNAMSDLDGDGIADIGLVDGSQCAIYSSATGAELFYNRSWEDSSLISIGDLNADGVDEFIVGAGTAGGYDQAQGTLDCFDGATKTLIWDYYVGEFGYPDGVGGCLLLIDDVDHDGYRDIATGKGNSGNSYFSSGIEIFSAKTGTPLRHWNSPFGKHMRYEKFGRDIACGDLDGDGQLELLIGESEVHHKYGKSLDKFAGVVLVADLIY